MQVRDTAVEVQDDVPKSIVNREYYIQNTEKMVSTCFGANVT